MRLCESGGERAAGDGAAMHGAMWLDGRPVPASHPAYGARVWAAR